MDDGLERMERLAPRASPAGDGIGGEGAEAPPALALRPAGVGRLLDRTLEVLRRRFLALATTAWLLWLPAEVLVWLGGNAPGMRDPEQSLGRAPLDLGLTVLVSAFVARIAFAALGGEPVSTVRAWREVGARLPAVVLAFLLTVACVLLLLTPALALGIAGGDVGLGMGLLLSLPLLVWGMWRLCLVQIAVVLERAGPLRALRRSLSLTGRGFWRFFWAMVLSTCLTLPLAAGSESFADGSAQAWLRETVPALAGPALDLLSLLLVTGLRAAPTAFQAVLLTVIHVDQRVRREGLDLELRLARRAGQAAVPRARFQPGGLA